MHARTHARWLPCGAAREGAGAFQAAAARVNAAGCRRQRRARMQPAAAARARGFFRPQVRCTPPLLATIHPHTLLQTLRHVAVPVCPTHTRDYLPCRPSLVRIGVAGPQGARPLLGVHVTGCTVAGSVAARPRNRRRSTGPRLRRSAACGCRGLHRLPLPRRLAAPRRPGPPQRRWLRRPAAGQRRLRRAKQQAGPHCGRAPVTPTLLRQPGSQAPSRNERPRAHPNGRHPTPGRRPARAPAGRPFVALWRPVATRTQRGRGCRRGWRRSATSGAGPGCPPPPSPRVRDILGASAVAPVAPALGGQAFAELLRLRRLGLAGARAAATRRRRRRRPARRRVARQRSVGGRRRILLTAACSLATSQRGTLAEFCPVRSG
jgi:hypothetical protein